RSSGWRSVQVAGLASDALGIGVATAGGVQMVTEDLCRVANLANALQTNGAERVGTRRHSATQWRAEARAGRHSPVQGGTRRRPGRWAFNPGVGGSIPSRPTKSRRCNAALATNQTTNFDPSFGHIPSGLLVP